MTGKSGRRLGNLPIPCVVQLYHFWKENNLLATSIHEYCGWFLLGKNCLIDWRCMNSVDFRNLKWRTVNRKYVASVEWQWISAKLQRLTLFSTMTDSLLTPPITVTLLSSSAQHSRDAMYFRLTISNSDSRPTSGNVGSVANESVMVENVGLAVGISLITHSIPEIQSTSCLQSAILNSGSRPTSGNV